MRRPITIVISLALIAGVVWLSVDLPVGDDRPVTALPTKPPIQEMPLVVEAEASLPVETTAPSTEGDVVDVPTNPDAWEVVEYGDFVNVREFRRHCRSVFHFLGAGEGDEVTTCERKFEFDHPYALFSDDQLAQIASTDGEAAFILAHRQLYPAEPGGARDIEAGVNNVLDAMIRGAEGQALDLLLDESVFSPHTDLKSFLLWSMVGQQLDIARPEQVERLLKFRDVATLGDIRVIEQKAVEIADLLRQQRLIVLGTEF